MVPMRAERTCLTVGGMTRRARLALLSLAAAAVAVVMLRASSSMPSLGAIRHPDALWLSLALATELASLVAYALLVHSLLALWGVAGRRRALLRATVGGIAMGASLPGGQALSTAYWYKQLRREGAERGLAAVVLAGAMFAGALSLAVLLVVGVAVAGDAGPLAKARLPILAGAGALLVLRLALGRRLYALLRRVLRRFSVAFPEDVAIARRRRFAIAGLACSNWLLDCGCLLAALAAMHASVPWRSVLVTYALAQVVASLPLLPGGGGTVEVSLSLGFAAFGRTSGAVIAGVLLFRVISCWGLVPIGWLAVALDGSRLSLQRPRAWLGRPVPVR